MKTTIAIQNLKCGGCAHTITTAVSNQKGISNVTVNVEQNTVSFDYKNDEDIKNVTSKLLKIGYPIVGDNNSIGSKAKSYVSCAIGKMNK